LSRPSFELRRADLTERRATSALVIEHFNVVEQDLLRVAEAVEAAASLFTVEKKLATTALS
jgi:hypothetical protein